MALEDFLAQRIYRPLGMVDTLNHEDPAKLQRMATVYRGKKNRDGHIDFTQGFTPGDPPDFPVVRASGGLISTAMDYAKFLQMYLDQGQYPSGRILSVESVKKGTTPYIKVTGGGDGSSYGFGWFISDDGVFAHSGSDGTYAWVDPSRDVIGLVFTQSPGGNNPRQEFKKLIEQACTGK
jgi:CubicO group peptidase (beta-lactamase class C family)